MMLIAQFPAYGLGKAAAAPTRGRPAMPELEDCEGDEEVIEGAEVVREVVGAELVARRKTKAER